MNSPQLEKGYLRIASEIVDGFARLQISGNQWRCLWFLIRKTYGYQKRSDFISLKQFMNGTGLAKTHISRALKQLRERNVVTKSGNEYALQKNPDKWIEKTKAISVPKDQIVTKTGNLFDASRVDIVTNNGNGITKTGNKSLPKMVITKDSYKDTFSKDILQGNVGNELPAQIRLSIWFHSEQKKRYPTYSLWSTDKKFIETVCRGAVTVEKLIRLDKWEHKDIAELLEWILNDSHWSTIVKSLAPIRDKKSNDQRKIENAKDWMLRQKTNKKSGNLGNTRKRLDVDRDRYADNR